MLSFNSFKECNVFIVSLRPKGPLGMGLNRYETVTLDSFVVTQPILRNIRCEIDFFLFCFVRESVRPVAVTSGSLPIKHDRKVRAQWLARCYRVSESLSLGKKRHLMCTAGSNYAQFTSLWAPVLSIIHLLPVELTRFFLNKSSSTKRD